MLPHYYSTASLHSSCFSFSEVVVWLAPRLRWNCTLTTLPALLADWNSVINKDALLTHLKGLLSLKRSHPSHSAHAAVRKAESKHFLLHHLFSGFHSSILPKAACSSIEVLWQYSALPILVYRHQCRKCVERASDPVGWFQKRCLEGQMRNAQPYSTATDLVDCPLSF